MLYVELVTGQYSPYVSLIREAVLVSCSGKATMRICLNTKKLNSSYNNKLLYFTLSSRSGVGNLRPAL
jgi:hypothetical protein